MWVSGRQAAGILAPAGLSRRGAERVLRAGLAGEPVRTSSSLLYDEDRVRALASRPRFNLTDLGEICSWRGAFLARREVSVDAPWDEQVSAASGGWRLGMWTGALLGAQFAVNRPLPFLAMVRGFVVFGAEVVGLAQHGDCVRLELVRPGPWYPELQGLRFIPPLGGPFRIMWPDPGFSAGDASPAA
jgi:hypothetical protein